MDRADILGDVPQHEYPTAYLLVRLQGRRARFFRDWQALLLAASPAQLLVGSPIAPFLESEEESGPWEFLDSEYRWVYARLNRRLRAMFQPFFRYHQARTLLGCLRDRAAGRAPADMAARIGNSLLHPALKGLLADPPPFSSLLAALEKLLGERWPGCRRLGAEWRRNGFQACEHLLRENFLTHGSTASGHPVLLDFFRLLIDRYNIMALAKTLRWHLQARPSFIAGGVIPLRRLERSFRERGMRLLAGKGLLATGDVPCESLAVLENRLRRNLETRLRRDCFPPSETGFILLYLWDLDEYVRRVSTILHAGSLAHESVAAELE